MSLLSNNYLFLYVSQLLEAGPMSYPVTPVTSVTPHVCM